MEHEETVKRAAAAGMPERDFADLMRDILRGNAPPVLMDKDLEEDSPPPSKPAQLLSAEQALCHLKGSGYAQNLNQRVSQAQREISAAEEASEPLRDEIKQAVIAHLSFLKARRADAQMGLLAAVLLAALVMATVLGEMHLLVAPLADWMGIEHLDAAKLLWLGSAAAVVLSFLGLLAHEVLQETRPKPVRLACASALVVSSLLIGYLRSSQVPEDAGAKVVFYLWWCWISFGAPIVTARLIDWLWPQLRGYLAFKAEENYFLGLRKHEEGRLEEQRSRSRQAEDRTDTVLQQFTEAYQDLAFADGRKLALARGTRRQVRAALAQHLIAFRYWLKLPPQPPVRWLVIALGVLGIMLLSRVLRAEELASPPAYTVVLCDRSDSSVDLACSSARIAAAFDAWAPRAMASRAGQFDVLVIGSGVHDVELLFSEPAPKTFRPPLSQSKRSWLRIARQRVLEASLPAKKNASAILEGIYAASFRLSGLRGDRQLVMMSDLRQVSGRWNFERRVPENIAEWLEALPGNPELREVRVSVCGFHTSSAGGSKTTVSQLIQLRRLWSETFSRWGIPDVSILEECAFDGAAGNPLAATP